MRMRAHAVLSLPGVQLRIERVAAADARGPCWARHRAQALLRNEAFFMQIDAHMLVVAGWDFKLLQMWCAETLVNCTACRVSYVARALRLPTHVRSADDTLSPGEFCRSAVPTIRVR
jgi:hypothetical protein